MVLECESVNPCESQLWEMVGCRDTWVIFHGNILFKASIGAIYGVDSVGQENLDVDSLIMRGNVLVCDTNPPFHVLQF